MISMIMTIAPLLMGDEGSSTVHVGWRVQSAQTLSILGADAPGSPTVASAFVVPQPDSQDLERGFIERRRALVLVARSNTPWTLSVRTDDPNMGTSFDGQHVKPISDLWVRAEGGRYITVGNADQVIASGPPGEHHVGVDYRVRFDRGTYREGYYRITVLYTISTR
jgi:hypothetical protein